MAPASPAQTTGRLRQPSYDGFAGVTVPDVVLAQDKTLAFNPWWASEDKVLFVKSMELAACLGTSSSANTGVLLMTYCIACPIGVCLP